MTRCRAGGARLPADRRRRHPGGARLPGPRRLLRGAPRPHLRAALALSDRGEPVDILTLKVQLERDGSLARSGGIEYLAELSQKMPTAASVPHYAQIVVDHSMRRRLIAAAGEMAQLGFDAGQRTDESSTPRRGGSSPSPTPGGAWRSATSPRCSRDLELMESRAQSRQIVHGVPTNYSRLDAVTQGLQPGELIILAARPSVGKTSCRPQHRPQRGGARRAAGGDLLPGDEQAGAGAAAHLQRGQGRRLPDQHPARRTRTPSSESRAPWTGSLRPTSGSTTPRRSRSASCAPGPGG